MEDTMKTKDPMKTRDRKQQPKRTPDAPKPKLPSLAECRAAGTHMVRCTADGFCKVCFQRDADDVLFVVDIKAPAVPATAAAKPLTITLKNVKHAEFASEETNCFSADVYIDGKKEGTAENDGHGGATFINPYALAAKLDAYGATLPRITSTTLKDETDPTGFFTYTQTGETLIDDLLEKHLLEKDVKRALSRRVLFTMTGKPGLYQLKPMKAAPLKALLAEPNLATKLKADKVLNLLPLEEAVALYKANATAKG
jgi:hypothetical protein